MKNEIRRKKKIVFAVISLFFFSSMIFLYYNISWKMYENASIIISIKEAKDFQKIILTSIYFEQKNSVLEKSIGKVINIIKNINSYPPVYSIKIFSKDRKLLYTWGRQVELTKHKTINDLNGKSIIYNRTTVKQDGTTAYEVIFTLETEGKVVGYGETIYDLTAIQHALFKERRVLFFIIFMFNFFIILFLIINILNLQKRTIFLEKEFTEVSTMDSLTRLYNKDHFLKIVKNEVERISQSGGKVSLITVDIDNYLDINEKYGYEFGDLVLQTISKICQASFRNFDILGRFGGDEIMVLVVDSTEEEAFIAAEKCRASIEENKFYYETEEITITASFGVASTENMSIKLPVSPDKNKIFFRRLTFNSLNALTKAKRSGKNKVIKNSESKNES
jgi:diguanylate cyclase (GGDEF)-like protein